MVLDIKSVKYWDYIGYIHLGINEYNRWMMQNGSYAICVSAIVVGKMVYKTYTSHRSALAAKVNYLWKVFQLSQYLGIIFRIK